MNEMILSTYIQIMQTGLKEHEKYADGGVRNDGQKIITFGRVRTFDAIRL